MSAMAAAAWTPTEFGHASQIPTRLPEEMEIHLSYLTAYGKELLEQEIAEAMNGPDPLVALTRVLSSWWYTLMARHEPGYLEAMNRPVPEPAEAVYQTTEGLKTELGV